MTHDKVFHYSMLWKRKVKVTYLLHLWVVFVLAMVWSRLHHLRHQWSQISAFVSLNHIRYHNYLKSSYVPIQVFHILHHHTMKLLLAFKSFLPWGPIVEIGSENWFAAGCPIRHRNCFATGATIPATNATSLQPTCFAAANATSLQPTRFAAANATSL